jgi:hypothetical protein
MSLILTLPKKLSLITYCSRCGTLGYERHLPFLDKFSSRFRVFGWLSRKGCTVMIYGVQRRGAMGKMKVARPQKVLVLLVADVAELADALDSKSGNRKVVWVRPPPSAPLKNKGETAV